MNITHFIQFAKYAAEEAAKDAAKDAAKSTPPKSIQGRFADVVKNDPAQAYAFYQQNANEINDWANGGMPTNVAGALAAYRNNPHYSGGDRGGPFSTPVNTAIQQRLMDANDNYERLMSLARFYNAQNSAGLSSPRDSHARAAAISKLLNKPETPFPQGADVNFEANLLDRLLNSPNRTLLNSLF